MRAQRTKSLLFLLPLLLLTGCAERRAQVAVQSALTGLAHGFDAADAIVASEAAEAAVAARAQVLMEHPGDVEAGLARYDELMTPWTGAVLVLRTTRSALLLAQGGVTVWIETGELPATWAPLCDGVEQAVAGLLELLEELGVDVPDEITRLRPLASTVCQLAGPWFRR